MHEAYAARGFRVVRVPPLDVPLGAALNGRPVSAEKKSGAFAGRGGAWVSLRELGASGRGQRVVVLEEGQAMPLLVFVAGEFRGRANGGSAPDCRAADEGGGEQDGGQAAAAADSMRAGVAQVSRWNAHMSRSVVHTGYESVLVRSFAFAYDIRAGKYTGGGRCRCRSRGGGGQSDRDDAVSRYDCRITKRSTLRKNARLVDETLRHLIVGADGMFRRVVLEPVTSTAAASGQIFRDEGGSGGKIRREGSRGVLPAALERTCRS